MNKFIQQAFTLIELLVVIAIIGILSGLVIVTMNGVTEKTNIAKSQIFSNSLRNALMLNLVSEWKFDGSGVPDGGTATTAYTQDSWSGGNSCAIVGSPLVYSNNKCVSGSCLYFGISSYSYLNCGNKPNLDITDKLTIESWILVNQYPTSYAGHILTKGNGGVGETTFDLYLFGPTGGYKYICFYGGVDGAWSAISNSYLMELSKWYHVVFTYNDALGGTLYINGKSKGLYSLSGSLGTNTKNFMITNGGAGGFDGYIDNVRIYNTIVPTSQIKEQYYAGLNSLLSSGGIDREEYAKRLNETAKN